MEPLNLEWGLTAHGAWSTRLRDRALRAGLADPALIGLAIVLTAVAQPHLFTPETLVSLDTATQYYPWYAYLGQTLRTGHLPGWNPATFSGTPFAANPLGGWTYVPAMLVFALLPVAQAIRAYLLIHPLMAACGMYALSRVLRLRCAGALLAAIAYANTSFLQVQNASSSPFASVYAWLPFAVVGAELAIRAKTWSGRFGGWGLSAVSISQIIAVWPGQGAYYASLLVGGYIAYRTLLAPARSAMLGPRSKIGALVLNGGAIFVLAAALDAAGILPRLEFNALSNLAGGYSGAEARVGGLHPKDWLLLAIPGFWYVGASVLGLAIGAAWMARWRLPGTLGYFGVSSLLALLISGKVETPLHWLLYHLLPGFARLHPHAPERVLTVAYLGPALLAGAGFDILRQRGWRIRRLRLSSRRSPLAAAVVVLVVAADLALAGAKARSDVMLRDPINGADKLTPVDLESYFQPDAAALFLKQRLAETPGRFISYAPYLRGVEWPYSTRFMDPATAPLQVNNRALPLGLQDAQGYDAAHLDRYDLYFTILNGRSQNYHDAEVFWAGLSSPLLDLLNVRYLVVMPPDRVDLTDAAALRRFSATVYQDAHVRILQNPAALPRAWIVHTATQASARDALLAIDSGRVKASDTALLEEPPPPVEPAVQTAVDRAEVISEDADRLVVSASSGSAGLLVLSEVYYPAWQAYVDAQPVRTYVADGALRAVWLSTGAHTVEFRFQSATLTAGVVISLLAMVVLALPLGTGAYTRLVPSRRALHPRVTRLPDDKTRLRLANADRARDAGGNSIT